MPPDLPGFYWDAEKGRYFKVVANGKTTVNQQTNELTPMENYTRSSLNLKKRLSDRVAKNPVPTSALPQNISMNKLSDTSIASIKAQRIFGTPRAIKPLYTDDAISNCVHYDKQDQLIYGGSSSGKFVCLNPGGFELNPGPGLEQAITSISSNRTFVSFTQNSDQGSSYVFIYSKPTGQFVSCQLPKDRFVNASQWHNKTLLVGGLGGVHEFDPETQKFSRVQKFEANSASALDSDGEFFAAGYRNGTVKVYKGNEGIIIDHNASVTNLKLVEGSRALVTGFDDRMCLYDLRKPSIPIVVYKSYHNYSTPHVGLALSPEGTMAAAAVDDGSLLIYNLLKRSPVYCPLKENKVNKAIRGVEWVDTGEILINDGHTLSMAGWGPSTRALQPAGPSELPGAVRAFWEQIL
ncbi:p21-activated protein kinase-interacting protein 1 [Wickerhamiella sorbophila]|uniref:p21-activated protein kinase-interacting protein 1 n=1 Tax=Wickerhamiella sorbophila TaxID=45607 RepID=A0A2T0FGN3_9ASCO|nr:p21-activated protein kinase-interacting protein 1 [Wickerhamiella sorbophila]PRT54109.1 p21-activated protein kinase-interacting protein 1 [Wickerhamiella sorbophila]